MPQPEPKQEVKPDPVSEAIAANETEADAIELPTEAPAPEAKPKPPKAQTAKTPDRKEAEKPVKQAAAKPKSEEKEFDADEVAALLNKEKASGGGAKRSTETASLGGDKTTGGEKLSQSEMDALRGQVQRCWNIPAGAADAGDSARLGQVQARPLRRARRQPRDHQRRRQRRRRTRRGRSRAPRRLALRALQSSRRKIRSLGGRHRQFRPKRDVLSDVRRTSAKEADCMKHSSERS